jgi:hypothetical protein
MMFVVLGAVLGYLTCAFVSLWRLTSRMHDVIDHVEWLAKDEDFNRAFRLVHSRMTDRNLATSSTWWLNDPKVRAKLEGLLRP